MAFPFALTEDATADLEEAISYLAEENEHAALKVADELEDAFRFVAEWPLLGHRREDLTDSPDVRFWRSGRYLIAYLPEKTPVLILAVYHGSRDIQSLLPRRLGTL